MLSEVLGCVWGSSVYHDYCLVVIVCFIWVCGLTCISIDVPGFAQRGIQKWVVDIMY